MLWLAPLIMASISESPPSVPGAAPHLTYDDEMSRKRYPFKAPHPASAYRRNLDFGCNYNRPSLLSRNATVVYNQTSDTKVTPIQRCAGPSQLRSDWLGPPDIWTAQDHPRSVHRSSVGQATDHESCRSVSSRSDLKPGRSDLTQK
jgi:hypothetical protein